MGEFSQFARHAGGRGGSRDASHHVERSEDSGARVCRRYAGLFALKPADDQPIPSDTIIEEELVEASASPLNRKQRDALIQSGLAATTRK
jgi:hypothetical protein